MSENSYRWRKLSDAERHSILKSRHQSRVPWHSPRHVDSDAGLYLYSAACFEHRPIIGNSLERMNEFSVALNNLADEREWEMYGWVVLPNHYHFLAKTGSVKEAIQQLGRLHGRTSFKWNRADDTRGRQVWFNAAETAMKSERHFWASLLYVFHNPVKHGYAARWQDWPFSNAMDWLQSVGRDQAVQTWKEFPIEDYGSDWDPPDL